MTRSQRRQPGILLLYAAIMPLLCQAVMAAEPVKPAAAGVSFSQIASLLAGLLIVLLVFLAVVFLLRRLSVFNGTDRGHMRVVDALHLGTRERLVIVQVQDRHLLLGVSQQGIHPLHVLGADFPGGMTEGAAETPPSFSQLLSRLKPGRA